MASSQCLLLSSLAIILSFSLTQSLKFPSDLEVFHMYSPSSPLRPSNHLSWVDTIIKLQTEDEARLQFLGSLAAGRNKSVVSIAWGRNILQSPTYIVKAKFGTPGQSLLLALDTSNDNVWIPCTACVGCGKTGFAPAKSTTYKKVHCGAPQCGQVPGPVCSPDKTCSSNFTYGSSSIVTRVSQDTLKLVTQEPIPKFTFGCIEKTTGGSTPPQGLLGLGRGPLSLPSQTYNLYKSTFSYCLPSFKSTKFSGSLRLGPVGQPPKIKTTPLLKNPRRSSLYYVKMIGIKVAKKVLDIPPTAFAFNPTTGAGTIFDSGTSFTTLVKPAYTALSAEFRRRMGKAKVVSLGGFDTCYTVPITTIPSITFMFNGLNFTLKPDNFLIKSTAGSTTCLAMAAAPDNLNSVLNVIANMQQQNHRVLFDIPNSRLGVAPQMCS
ncbi:hypothetical protein Leryth_001476 [Lithospermum erythrorhizon]|nr:hypothetical protein Leryth_001476 [Lithospermum erythrorhizon]